MAKNHPTPKVFVNVVITGEQGAGKSTVARFMRATLLGRRLPTLAHLAALPDLELVVEEVQCVKKKP